MTILATHGLLEGPVSTMARAEGSVTCDSQESVSVAASTIEA
jgi:hypothetical protein